MASRSSASRISRRRYPRMLARSMPATSSISSRCRSTPRLASSRCRKTTRSSSRRLSAKTGRSCRARLLEVAQGCSDRKPRQRTFTTEQMMETAVDPHVFYLIIFVLAIFVGYHVVWSVTPALHTPLMSVTNAISAIILVGAMLAAGPQQMDWGGWVGVVAVTLAAVNAFGGFLVTQRMLEMFRKKEPKAGAAEKR